MLLLGAALPRRADTTAVIGTALLASARGVGYRQIAAEIGRPEATVRRWVRSVRDAHTEWLRAQALGWIDAVDREVIATLRISAQPRLACAGRTSWPSHGFHPGGNHR